MPKGQRKKGQFFIKVWLPDGVSLSWSSIRNLTPEEWVAITRQHLCDAQRLVDGYAERHNLPSKETVREADADPRPPQA